MIRLVVALAAEAEPLAAHFRMTYQPGAFRWYRSEETALVVSGIGKSASAAAAAYLHARTGELPARVWVNAGIAGHGHLEPGCLLQAHTVRDGSSGRCWHPTRIRGPEIPAAEVVTVDAPESGFDRDAAYDMEAAGFYPTALRFSTTELVHVVKLVSDNRAKRFHEVSASDVRRLVESGVDAIDALVAHLRDLSSELPRADASATELEELRRRFRFTTTETRRLERLLARLRLLAPDEDCTTSLLSKSELESAEVLRRVEERVHRASLERPL